MSDKSIAQSLAQRLASERQQLEMKLASLPAGSGERKAIQKKLRQIETAASIDGWLSSPGLQPPT
ncbi:hypothetical protein [Bradyrhizobium sp. SYSU BS000235]|uniref:hypothetical protein n=1 Tax=Bradyrhizobium sp. SYSU BS000235 TaxID=3411332 RepID=UPI003C724194